jgi:hypothetical protein
MLLSRYEEMPFSKIKTTKKKRWNAIQIVVLGYLSVILFGTILLSLPFAKAEPVRFWIHSLLLVLLFVSQGFLF